MLVGKELGPFVLDEEVGSGATGTVYRARYTKTGQVVALEVLAPELVAGPALERFQREAAALQKLRHPNIVLVLGAGVAGGLAYCVMEYVRGESLERLLARRGRLPW